MADVAGVAAKVQAYMQDMGLKYVVEEAGRFSLRFDSIRIFVRVWTPKPDDADAPTFVGFTVPLLFGVNESPELHKYIAFHADDYIFGHLSLFKTDEGEIRVFYTHKLLGDYIDAAEFSHALIGMAGVANDLDEELQAQFGGSRFHEDD